MNWFHMSMRSASLLITFAIVGCEEVPAEEIDRIRSIKPYYVVEPTGGDVRRYSGTVVAANTSTLSFAVSGSVQTIEVSEGDRVSEGQLLATLDNGPFKLNLQAAQAELVSAKATFEQRRVELDRQKQLFERGWVAKAAFDQAENAFEAADGGVNLAYSRVGLASRDLANSRMTAPFAGIISKRNADPFTEASVGKSIFQLDSEGALEIKLAVPDTIISKLTIGAPVTIEASTIEGCGCTGRITAIGARSDAANVVSVKAAILSRAPGILPGMTIEASIVLSTNGGASGFLVPLVAIAPGDDKARGYVFKYNPENGLLNKVPIKGDGPASGNLIGVNEGVEAGDIIAAAGVSFLRHGQRVKLIGE